MENQIELLTKEQIEQFPEAIRKQIKFLSENIGTAELAEFNPLVSELLTIQELGSKLKLIPANEEGKFDKENIQSFTDVKKTIRSYRATVKETAKALKRPRLDENKAIGVIEKTFVQMATDVFEAAEKEFDAYIKAEEIKAAERQKKRDAALNAKIDKATSEAKEQTEKNNRSQAYNKIKYERIAENITQATQTAILESNEKKLMQMKNEFQENTYEDLIAGVEFYELLSEDLIAELKLSRNNAIRGAIALIDDKLASYQSERDNLKNVSTVPAPAVTVEQQIPAPPAGELNDVDFCKGIISEVSSLLERVNDRLEKNPSSSPHVYGLKNVLTPITKIHI